MTTATNQIGLNAVSDLGLDNTGQKDIGPALNTFFASQATANIPELYFPSGTYLIKNPVVLQANSKTMKSVTMIGEGRAAYGGWGSTVFLVDTPGETALWFNNSQTSSGNEKGPRIEHISFVDTSRSAYSGLRITQFNNVSLNDVSFADFSGCRYTQGQVLVTKGNDVFQGDNTLWNSGMFFGHLQVDGKLQEIAYVTGPKSGVLTSEWQFESGSFPYLIGYGGIGLLLEGTSASGFTQYGCLRDVYGFNNRVWIQAAGSPSPVAGVSRIRIIGGRNNGNRLADSLGIFLGKYSDTVVIDTAQNNVPFPVVIESGHAHVFRGEIEDNGLYSVVTTANGGQAGKAWNRGVVLNADGVNTAKDNIIVGGYIYSVGNAIEVWSPFVTQLQIANNRLRSNQNNYAWADGTVGVPVVTQGTDTTALVSQIDFQGGK